MSNSPEATKFLLPAVSKPNFLGLVWGSLGVSAIFLFFRAYVRLKVFRRFFIDDGFLLLAWILLLTSAALWQSMIDDLYLIFGVTVGTVQPPADILDILFAYFHRTVAVSLLNIFSLWSIKASFLVFFHKLGNKVRGHNIIWWTAVVACFTGFAISIGVQNYKCITGPQEKAIAACSTKAYGDFIYRAFRLQAACDVITDAFIMAVPIKILWDVQISARSKAGLIVLFSLTLFTMIVAIIRVTLSLRHQREDDSWIFVWAAIEPAVGMIIASAISYRALAHKERRQSGYTPQTGQKTLRYGTSQGTSSHGNDSRVHAGKSSSDSSLGEEVVPLDGIRVRKDYDVIPSSELGVPVY